MLKNFKNFALFQKIKTRIKKFDLEKHLVKTIIGIFAVSFVISIIGGTSTLISSVSLPLITAIFAFLAYKYNKEKFRLELFEKRWEFCKNINVFCSIVIKYANFPKPKNPEDANYEEKKHDAEKLHNAVAKSFRGQGYHLGKILFSNDLENTFQKLNNAYSFFATNEYPNTNHEYGEKSENHVLILNKINNELPELFKPYLYFGDYKND